MVWGVNPSPKYNPAAHKYCPEVAKEAAKILQPTYRFAEKPPLYTRAEGNSGWLPSVARAIAKKGPKKTLIVQPSAQSDGEPSPPRGSMRRPRFMNVMMPPAADMLM